MKFMLAGYGRQLYAMLLLLVSGVSDSRKRAISLGKPVLGS